ncbi:hypothetical protein PR048_005621 [Dryococelus australis]|uniref:Integrase catalytic domain-containing protein n=1 Tax=Dryococelus australis TaxID=614101 RepID=A0ABQ9I8N6_9NEOP|nr:hypothetical protein PR048_005621 [Dryococelus australis]
MLLLIGAKEDKTPFHNCAKPYVIKPILKYPDFSLPFLQCMIVLTPLWEWYYLRKLMGRNTQLILFHMKELRSHLARWSLLLSEYDFDIVHKVGKANANMDVLSRIPVQLATLPYEPEQERDPVLAAVKHKVESGEEISYFIDPDGLYKFSEESTTDMLVVPVPRKNKFLIIYRSLPFGGHQGVKHTYKLIKCMYRDVTEFCANSESCEFHKRALNNKPKFLEVIATFQRISINILGPLPTTNKGNKYILNFQDAFSKHPKAICLLHPKAETIAKAFVTEVVVKHGAPKQLLPDRGTNFTPQLMKEICTLLQINKLLNIPYYPASKG